MMDGWMIDDDEDWNKFKIINVHKKSLIELFTALDIHIQRYYISLLVLESNVQEQSKINKKYKACAIVENSFQCNRSLIVVLQGINSLTDNK